MGPPETRQLGSLVAELHGLLRRRRTLLVGIDGLGGSGKSLLASALRDLAPRELEIVRMDDFYRPARDRPGLDTEGYGESFDWLRLRDQVLAPLRRDQPARYQRYDWPSDRLSEWRTVAVGKMVVVEGVYSLRSELASFYDFTIWVECPREQRLARGVARDGADARERWLTDWMPEEDRYVTAERPSERADLVVAGYGSVDPRREFVETRRNNPASPRRDS